MFVRQNLNPKQKNTGDCVIRAIAKALDKQWQTVYRDLVEMGIKKAKMPNNKRVYRKYLLDNQFVECNAYRVDQDRTTVKQFADDHQKGVYIVSTRLHITCVIDGVIYDSWDPSHCVSGKYFKKL